LFFTKHVDVHRLVQLFNNILQGSVATTFRCCPYFDRDKCSAKSYQWKKFENRSHFGKHM